MGLDSFWVMPGETDEHPVEHPVFVPLLRLCGGMFSEHGRQSFRGKVYSPIIERLTGVSLYQDEIPNGIIQEIADKLDAADSSDMGGYGLDQDEFLDLQRMFRTYADAGATLRGWW